MRNEEIQRLEEELELIDWFFTQYPKEKRTKRFKGGLNKMKVLGIISHHPQGISRGEISNYLPLKSLNNYLHKLRAEGLIKSTYPYSPNTLYVCTQYGVETYKCLIEIAEQARRLWLFG